MKFYLVNLNRMNFHNSMSFNIRMKNFSRLTPQKEMIEIMGKEYAKLINKPEQEVIEEMWNKTIKGLMESKCPIFITGFHNENLIGK